MKQHQSTQTLTKNILRAFKYRNYRLFFAGQGISLIGTWMHRIAISWLVYRLTDSAFLLGLIGSLGQLPSIVFSPFAGVIADKYDRHRTMIVVQALSMIHAFVLSLLVLTDKIALWHIFILSTLLGIVNIFDIPVRQAFVIQMVEKKEDMGNTIAMNSFMFNSARLIGPSIAGILISIAGEGICFLLNGISYVAMIVALFAMKMAHQKKENNPSSTWQRLKEGSVYTFRAKPIRNILLLLGLVSFVGMPYTVLMPIFARDVLHGTSQTLGFLMASAGIGAILGALFLASRRNACGLERIAPIATMIFGIGLIIFSLSKTLSLSLILIALCGFGMMVQMASCNTLVQTIVDDDKRGRVMSFYSMAFMGPAPFGSLLAGASAERWGAPMTLIIGGILCIIGAVAFASKLSSFELYKARISGEQTD